NVPAEQLDHDLALSVGGGSPSFLDAGLTVPRVVPDLPGPAGTGAPWVVAGFVVVMAAAAGIRLAWS
ncbi:MAG: hypothetical protein ACREIV_05430, partial [Planctomycetaceae bacterium]